MWGLTVKFWLVSWLVIVLVAGGIVMLVTRYASFESVLEVQRAPDRLMDRLAGEFEYRSINNGDVKAFLLDNNATRFSELYLISPNGQDLLERPLPEGLKLGATNTLHLSPQIRNRTGELTILTRAINHDAERHLLILAFREDQRLMASVFQRIGFGALPAMAVLILGLASLFLAFLVVRPLNQLSEASDRLGEGPNDLRISKRLLNRRDEIGHLARRMTSASSEIQRLLVGQKELVRDLSHEVRSPLARLQIAAELLQEDPQNPLAVQRVIEDVHVIDQLVESLLLLSKEDTLGHSAPKEIINLIRVLEQCVCAVDFEGREKGTHIHFFPSIDPVPCLASKPLLSSLFENLLRNAILHSPSGTSVDVGIQITDDHCTVHVADQGPGVPESRLSDIFEPFTRIDSSRTRNTGGHGLGLAIARKIALSHGGHIEAENLKEGGLAMRVTLPLAPKPTAGS